MLLAILDYLDFKDEDGRYTAFMSDKMASWCYYRFIPENELQKLKQGDIVISGNFNSPLSWLIMYLTDSTFSHCMLYDSDGFVAHVDTAGYRYQNIRELFGSGKRFLSFSLPDLPVIGPDRARTLSYELRARRSGGGYDWLRIGSLGLSYLFCVNPRGYHPRQLGDLAYAAFCWGWFWMIFGGPPAVLLFVFLAASLLAAYHQVCRKFLGPEIYPTTPESFVRLAVYGYFKPQLNILGFRNHLMGLWEALKDRGMLEAPPGTSFPTPEGLRKP